jgi:cytochrome c
MKTMIGVSVLSLAGLLVSPAAFADSALAASKNCMVCHAMDTKKLGPAYKAIAAKYAGQADMVDKLAVKIIKGGSGAWGAVPMPANAQVNEAEAKRLATWILNVK